jgi:hypothetical protein
MFEEIRLLECPMQANESRPPNRVCMTSKIQAVSSSSRRAFLAGSVATALLAEGNNNAHSAPSRNQSALTGVYDVTSPQFGAVGDGKSGDSRAIQAAIDAAGAVGGVVWFPAGTYLIDAGLIIPRQVVLDGCGWGPPYTPANGSTLLVRSAEMTPITIKGRGTTIRNLAMYHIQPDAKEGWAPAAYPAAIRITGCDDVRIENVFLQNPTVGIQSEHSGRVTIERLWGQPLRIGVTVDTSFDVFKMDNVHFWPFWSNQPSVRSYMNENAVAIESLRNDNPHYSNVFALGYAAGFHFGRSSDGITSKFHIVNADIDLSNCGIKIDGAHTTGQISNFTMQGNDAGAKHLSEPGLTITAEHCVVQAANLRITNVGGAGALVSGNHSYVALQNGWIENWDQEKSGHAAVEAANGASAYVGAGSIFTGSESPRFAGPVHIGDNCTSEAG